jgi:TRAP-type transport system small permease protein
MLISTIDRFIKRFENYLGYLLTFSIVCIVTAQVIFRFVLSKPLSWSQEAATYLLIWMVLLGMVIAQREKANIAVNILTQYFSRYETVIKWIPWISMVLLFSILGFGGAEIARTNSVDTSPTLGIPMWIVFIAFPITAALGLWHLATEIPELIKKNRKEERVAVVITDVIQNRKEKAE